MLLKTSMNMLARKKTICTELLDHEQLLLGQLQMVPTAPSNCEFKPQTVA